MNVSDTMKQEFGKDTSKGLKILLTPPIPDMHCLIGEGITVSPSLDPFAH